MPPFQRPLAYELEEAFSVLCHGLPGLQKKVEHVEITGSRLVAYVCASDVERIRALLSGLGSIEVRPVEEEGPKERQLLLPFDGATLQTSPLACKRV
jgi:hypothetical protein